MGGKETLAEKGGVDAVRIVAFAYDTYTNPSKNNGVLCATLTLDTTDPQAVSNLAEEWTFLNRWQSTIHEAAALLTS